MNHVRWEILPPAPADYVSSADLPPVIAQLLYNRGIKPEEIKPFIAADSQLQGNPFLLPDMLKAVNRIYKALLSREKIAIYGDLDVDGVTATAVLVETLSKLGAETTAYIPDRFTEGHGLKSPAIEKLHNEGAGLIITVDCGISDLAAAKKAHEMGQDMIITDHHIPLATLPPAIAVIDAKRKDSQYPCRDLAGVGVAFKLAQALFHNDNRQEWLTELLDLVALGTVADMVPLVGENRYLVAEGVRTLNSTKRIGLQEMARLAGLKPGDLNSESISWVLGPRLNASGRLGSATTSYRLLTIQSPEEVRSLARELEESNAERKQLTGETLCKAKEALSSKPDVPLLINGDESYPLGVIGLVAGKLVEEFYKPAVIVSLGPELCRGSSRSIPEFNIAEALEQCHDLLVTFGGHHAAAGFSIKPENLPRLEERLLELAQKQLSHLDLRPRLAIDAEVPLSKLAGGTINLMQQLEPFGQGNPSPTFLSRHVEVVESHSFGNGDKWLKMKLKQGNIIWAAVDFESHRGQEEVVPFIDIVYHIGRSRWNGEQVLQLKLLDFAPSK
ncbi:MAG: single-stranded-DNA-specific exonuclease RecJ [Chloroflexota bacterium]|nr:single-stranded-DNA-specific exonuclease RecJ [Chloroflexota bacterium]